MVIILDQMADVFTMVDAAIIHDEYTAGTRKRVGKWHLFGLSINQINRRSS